MTTEQTTPRQPGEPSTNKPAPVQDTLPADTVLADKPAASSKTVKTAKE